MFRVGPRTRTSVSVSVSLSFGCVADGSVRTRPAQVLAEVLEGEVARRLEAGLEGLHDDGGVLAGRVQRSGTLRCVSVTNLYFSPLMHLSVIHCFGSRNHPVQTLGHDGDDSSLGLGEAPVRLPELHRSPLIHVLQVLEGQHLSRSTCEDPHTAHIQQQRMVSVRYLEDVWDGVVEMLPLLAVEVLQLGGVLVLALVGHVRPRVEVVFCLRKRNATQKTLELGSGISQTAT